MQPPAAILYLSGNHSVLKSVTQLAIEDITIDLFPADIKILGDKLKSCVPDILVLSVNDNQDWKGFFKKIFIDCTVVAINASKTLNDSDLYDFGADAVFPNGVHAATLLKWLHRRIFQINSFKQLTMDADAAVQTANIAMTNAGELGRVIHFIEKTFDYRSSVEVARGIFSLSRSVDLKASVLFRWSNGNHEFFNCESDVIPEEDKSILEEHGQSGRIIDFGIRSLFNYPMISLFVKDMPLEDEERYGRIKDLIPIALGAINEKLMTLDQERTMYSNAIECIEAFEQFRSTIDQLAQTQNDNSTRAIFDLTAMKDRIFYTLPGMGLEEDQEKYIESVLQEALDKVADSFNESSENTASLLLTVEGVKSLTLRLETIAESFAPRMIEVSELYTQSSADESEFADDDIELF